MQKFRHGDDLLKHDQAMWLPTAAATKAMIFIGLLLYAFIQASNSTCYIYKFIYTLSVCMHVCRNLLYIYFNEGFAFFFTFYNIT